MKRYLAPVLGGVFSAFLLATPGCSKQSKADDDFGTVSQFSLMNQDGRKVTRDDFDGKVWIACFIFTRCAGPCTQISGSMARLQKDLAKREDIALVSFTVDPQHDKPKVLKEYAERFGADPKLWSFLTGDKKAVYKLIITSFKQGVQEASEADRKPGFEVTHSTRLALVDRKGHIRGFFDGTEEEDLKKLRQAALELAREKS